MSRRTIVIVVGALVLLLALTPFVPRGGDDEGIRPSGQGEPSYRPARTAGSSAITADARAEIERVVAAGRQVGRLSVKASPEQVAASLVRCAEFEGQRYCLGTGWTEDTEDEVRARVVTAARAAAARSAAGVVNTGDLDARSELLRVARMDPAARAAADRAELRMAARSVAKVWLLRHEIEGVPLPDDFLAEHPEARVAEPEDAERVQPASTPNTAVPTRTPSPTKSPTRNPTRNPSQSPTKAPVKSAADYPRRWQILDGKDTAEQTRSYWCGPTSMQMIVWGWRHRQQSQDHWAARLHTTTSGTSITEMVRVVNKATGWDKQRYAGPYVVLDIGGYSFKQWMLLMMRHVHDYKAPVILHPILLKRFYPYLDDDASGHYQVGRGYAKRGKKPDQLGYFEPWNQQRFDYSEPYIARVQWRDAYKSYRANQTHYAHNVGV